VLAFHPYISFSFLSAPSSIVTAHRQAQPINHNTQSWKGGGSAPGNTGRPLASNSDFGKQPCTSGSHNLTVHKNCNQSLVCTSKDRKPGESQRWCRRNIAEATKVPHDWPAKFPVCLDTGRHKVVAGIQMAWMLPALISVSQNISCAFHLGGSGNVGRAARIYMIHMYR
jgi:hypothetical protein